MCIQNPGIYVHPVGLGDTVRVVSRLILSITETIVETLGQCSTKPAVHSVKVANSEHRFPAQRTSDVVNQCLEFVKIIVQA